MSELNLVQESKADLAKMLLGTAGYADAQALRARLAREGIELVLIHNRETCTTGCSVKVEMWAHPADADDIQRILSADRVEAMVDLGYDPALLSQVYDSAAESAVCPACATEFSTSLSSCPDCGLCFGGAEATPASGGSCGSAKCK